jgi:A/G-specific adenine glycosylase
MKNSISQNLLNWYLTNSRDLPWRQTTDPYPIWLSEIILQQTRVLQGLPYYYKFIEAFPTVDALAKADENEVLILWQGLGYYSRARNLLACAKTVAFTFHGVFPNHYNSLVKLPGIGKYTAAAIASFAFNEKVPAIDGNVIRVISRIIGIESRPYSPESNQLVQQISHQWIGQVSPARYNQAIMEFGALQCVPKNPNCNVCPIASFCYAFQNKKVHLIPAPKLKVKIKTRFFYYFLIQSNDSILIEQRQNNDIWKNLFQLPLHESSTDLPTELVLQELVNLIHTEDWLFEEISLPIKHLLTHQQLITRFVRIRLSHLPQKGNWLIVDKNELTQYAFPNLVRDYLRSKNFIEPK